jgi:outer membrane lipoprotein-sorting protein
MEILKANCTVRSNGWAFLRLRVLVLAMIAAPAVILSGCSVSQTKVTTPGGAPVRLKTATKQELIAQYNAQADAVRTVNAGITMTLTAGSAYSGVIKQYHEISGFILAARPSHIRVIGQLPVVGTTIFDMESDGETFGILIPPQNRLITGPAKLERPSAKPIENLRPQHLLDAIFWPPLPQGATVLFEEAGDGSAQYFVLTLVEQRAATAATPGEAEGSTELELVRKIWFDRSDLHIARVTTYDAGGKIGSDIRYSRWDTAGGVKYAHQIGLARPGNDYTLEIGITKVTFNEDIPDERFVLKPPAGVETVHMGDDSPEAKP